MGNQRKKTTKVSTTHGKAKNAINKGFFKAFAQKGGLESPDLLTVKDPAKGVRNKKVNRPYPLAHQGKKIGAGLISAEPFTTEIIPNNYRKESK